MQSDVLITLMGLWGCGKSRTGNSILGRKAFDTTLRLEVRRIRQTESIRLNDGHQLHVMDTPGVGLARDPLTDDEKFLREIRRDSFPESFHAIALVFRFGSRITEDELALVKLVRDVFGGTFFRENTFIIVTFGDYFERVLEDGDIEEASFQEWWSKQKGPFRELVDEVQGRIILFNNVGSQDVKDKQREELFALLGGMMPVTRGYIDTKVGDASRKIEDLEISLKDLEQKSILESNTSAKRNLELEKSLKDMEQKSILESNTSAKRNLELEKSLKDLEQKSILESNTSAKRNLELEKSLKDLEQKSILESNTSAKRNLELEKSLKDLEQKSILESNSAAKRNLELEKRHAEQLAQILKKTAELENDIIKIREDSDRAQQKSLWSWIRTVQLSSPLTRLSIQLAPSLPLRQILLLLLLLLLMMMGILSLLYMPWPSTPKSVPKEATLPVGERRRHAVDKPRLRDHIGTMEKGRKRFMDEITAIHVCRPADRQYFSEESIPVKEESRPTDRQYSSKETIPVKEESRPTDRQYSSKEVIPVKEESRPTDRQYSSKEAIPVKQESRPTDRQYSSKEAIPVKEESRPTDRQYSSKETYYGEREDLTAQRLLKLEQLVAELKLQDLKGTQDRLEVTDGSYCTQEKDVWQRLKALPIPLIPLVLLLLLLLVLLPVQLPRRLVPVLLTVLLVLLVLLLLMLLLVLVYDA